MSVVARTASGRKLTPIDDRARLVCMLGLNFLCSLWMGERILLRDPAIYAAAQYTAVHGLCLQSTHVHLPTNVST